MSLSTKINHLFHSFVQKIRKMLNHVPLWIQLIFIMILLTTAVSVRLVHKDYTSTKELTLSQYLSTTSQILNLEAENSDWYLDSLAKFCIQPIMILPIRESSTRKPNYHRTAKLC